MVQVALTVSQPQQHTPTEMEWGYSTYGALLMDGWMDGWMGGVLRSPITLQSWGFLDQLVNKQIR